MRTLRIYCFPFHTSSSTSSIIYASEPLSLPTFTHTPSLKEKLLYVWPQRASEHWETWQHSESTWRKKVFRFGSRLLEQLPWQESLVKSWHKPHQIELACHPQHTCLVQSHFPNFLVQRQRYHQHYRRLSMACLPFSVLFSIVPGPNLPLFYNLFRCHAHHIAFTHLKTIPTTFSVHEQPSLPKAFPETYDQQWLLGLKHNLGCSHSLVEQVGNAWLQELKKMEKNKKSQTIR